MADLVISGLVIFILITLVVSDFRSREVSLIWLIVLGFCIVVRSLLSTDFNEVITKTFLNFILIGVMSLGIAGYLFVRLGKPTNPLKEHIGAGDVMFIILLTPIWEVRAFALFLITGFVGSIVYWLFSKQATVPLVGVLGILLCIYILIDIIQ